MLEVFSTTLNDVIIVAVIADCIVSNLSSNFLILFVKLSNTASRSQTFTAFMLVHSVAGLEVGIGRLMASVLEGTVMVVPEVVKSCAPEKVFPVV